MAELANRSGGDTFRCTGCKRLLSVPAGTEGPAGDRYPGDFDADPTGTDGISFPFGATSTDADRARLGSRVPRPAAPASSPAGPWEPLGDSRDRSAWERPGREQAVRPTAGPAPWAEPMPAPAGAPPAAVPDIVRRRPIPTQRAASAPAADHAIRVPALVRFLVWLVALPAGLIVAVFFLRAVGALEIDHVIDAYAGTGIGRFSGLFLLVPLWAALSSTAAHFAIEWVAKRRQGG
jgi:hypothetical protein